MLTTIEEYEKYLEEIEELEQLRLRVKQYETLGTIEELSNKDKIIKVLANKLFQSEFGRCYMCTNVMKNITLDGINNGCDGGCNLSEEFTVDDFIKKIVEELERTDGKENISKK